MLPLTTRLAAAMDLSAERVYEAFVTVPGGEPMPLTFTPGPTVSSTSGLGPRRTANVTLKPQPGVNLYDIVSTPGAVFDINYGIDFGGGDRELIPIFHGEAASGGVNVIAGDVQLSLVDLWQRLERCRFSAPVSLASGYRSVAIASKVTEAIPGVVIDQRAPLGVSITTAGVWDTSRTDFIKALAADGSLDVYFNTDGSFVIQLEPIINPTMPVWTYRTGTAANLIAASRSKPFDRLYNQVVVRPVDESQTWAQQTVSLSDPNDPRYYTKVGVVPFFYSSPTITSASEARDAGNTILQRVQGTTETLTIQALGNFAQEVGDTVLVIKPPTDTDPGVQAAHLVDSWTLRLDSGDMDLGTRSSALADVEES